MKNHFLKKLTIPCVVLLLIFCMVLSGCASRRSVSAEEFTSACENAGYTVEDVSAAFDPAFVTTALTVTGNTHSFGYYTFATDTEAKSNYAQFLSTAKTGADGEKFIDSTEYNRFYFEDSTSVTVLYRNGKNLIFISGMEIEPLKAIIDTLGI